MKNNIKNKLVDNSIHIWCANLDQPGEVVSGFYSILSDNEKTKIKKYISKGLRSRHIVSTGLARVLISNYTTYKPNDIIFKYNEFGKPFVSPDSNGNNLFFNLSHSYNYVVYVFTRNMPIGIDVEKVKELADMEGVVDLCFSESEKKWFSKVSSDKKEEIFYKIWTAKEAYIKAIGKGFSFSPKRISLGQQIENRLFVKEIEGNGDNNLWKLITFNPYPDFISSIMVENNNYEIAIENFNFDSQSGFIKANTLLPKIAVAK